jgi:hypothetical protein
MEEKNSCRIGFRGDRYQDQGFIAGNSSGNRIPSLFVTDNRARVSRTCVKIVGDHWYHTMPLLVGYTVPIQ